MRLFTFFLLFHFLAASAPAQTHGVIECRNELGVFAWEKPGSLVSLKYLACGEKLTVLGSDRDYVKIQLDEMQVAFVKAKNVRILKGTDASSSPGLQAGNQKEEARQPAAAKAAIPETTGQPQRPATRGGTFRSGIEVGFEVAPTRIRQLEPGTVDMVEIDRAQEAGVMLSAYGSYAFRRQHSVLKLDGRISYGNVQWTMPPGSPDQHVDDIKNYVFEPRVLFGWDFPLFEKACVTPLAGFGYRHLYDAQGEKQSPWGWTLSDRRSNYLYSPIGAEAIASLGNGWLLGGMAEYDYFWRGWQSDEWGDSNPSMPTMNAIQNHGSGARGSLRFLKNLGKGDFVFEPFVRYWDIKQSNPGSSPYYFLEPPSKSTEWGARLGVRF
jgi:hypothetical protein